MIPSPRKAARAIEPSFAPIVLVEDCVSVVMSLLLAVTPDGGLITVRQVSWLAGHSLQPPSPHEVSGHPVARYPHTVAGAALAPGTRFGSALPNSLLGRNASHSLWHQTRQQYVDLPVMATRRSGTEPWNRDNTGPQSGQGPCRCDLSRVKPIDKCALRIIAAARTSPRATALQISSISRQKISTSFSRVMLGIIFSQIRQVW